MKKMPNFIEKLLLNTSPSELPSTMRLERAANVLAEIAKTDLRKYGYTTGQIEDVYLAIAENSNTDGNTLDLLSNYNKEGYWKMDEDIRATVAENKNTEEKTLIRLSRDPSVLVRECVADNRNCPLDVLTQLSKDTESSVMFSAMTNPAMEGLVLQSLLREKLANDNDVAFALASDNIGHDGNATIDTLINPLICQSVWNFLSENENYIIRAISAYKVEDMGQIDRLCDDHEKTVRDFLAMNPNIDELTAEALLEKGDITTYQCLAMNPTMSEDILYQIYEKTNNNSILKSICKHNNVSELLLKRLSKVNDKDVREMAKIELEIKFKPKIKDDEFER